VRDSGVVGVYIIALVLANRQRARRGRRQARALLLPGTVTLLVPAAVVALEGGPVFGWGLQGAPAAVVLAVGVALLVAGVALWEWTVHLFARVGEGTLAPWDPPRRLVTEGPYAHVRNPMITGVLLILLGEAMILGSPRLLAWWAAFFAANSAFFCLAEEPALGRRFGREYRDYAANVPQWIPRRTAWRPTPGGGPHP